jgi:hypothetical protein
MAASQQDRANRASSGQKGRVLGMKTSFHKLSNEKIFSQILSMCQAKKLAPPLKRITERWVAGGGINGTCFEAKMAKLARRRIDPQKGKASV